MIGDDLAAVRPQVGDQRVGDALRSAPRVRPPVPGVRVRGKEEARGRGAERRQGGVGVREHAREQRVRLLGRERAAAQDGTELKNAQAESDGGERMPRHPQQLRTGEVHHGVEVRAERAQTASQARASRPSPSAVRSMSRQAMPARPPSRGWAYETSGVIHSMRLRSPNARKNGELSAAGWTAEPTSWRNPGRVSSAVRTPPPAVSEASRTRTE